MFLMGALTFACQDKDLRLISVHARATAPIALAVNAPVWYMCGMTIQERLRGMKKIRAARATGLARAHIQNLATNAKAPSVRAIVALADFLGVSDEEIVASVREWAGVHAANDNSAPIHKKSPAGESAVSP